MTAQQVISAIIYDRRGMILSIGKNSYVKTHTLQAKFAKKLGLEDKVYLHAEIDAILRCQDLSRAHRIFITRFNKHGKPALAAPCVICAEAIRALTQIKIIEFTK